MPELPEVETVRRGLTPVMEGFVFSRVTLNRPNLRFPFAPDFKSRIEGATLTRLSRRAKFLKAELSTGDRLFMHLGMSGRFTIDGPLTIIEPHNNKADINPNKPLANFVHAPTVAPAAQAKHDHVVFEMSSGHIITYNDPRRFGFMELVPQGAPYRLDDIGPEPLSNEFNAPALRTAIQGKKSKIKAALLDQKIVAGLGNIYVCEALYRAGLSPKRAAGRLTISETEALTRHIKAVITEAIEAGGSSLKDFASTEGALGYFQHNFSVYGREGDPCPHCKSPILRISQSGRSSFYCGLCQT